VGFAAEDSFEDAGFFKIGAEKFGQVRGLENSLRAEGFQTKRVSEGADGESGVGELAQPELG
jgi:hypothetical protein